MQEEACDDKQKLDFIRRNVACYPDFPKKGIIFRDIFSVLANPTCCQYIKDLLLNHISSHHSNVELIVGLESRGFLFNFMLASNLGIGCASIRKKGKLPGKCITVDYNLEYGSNTFEIQTNSIQLGQKVIIVDDLLATGGSLEAAIKLVRKAGGIVIGCLVIIELVMLEGNKKLDTQVHSLIKF